MNYLPRPWVFGRFPSPDDSALSLLLAPFLTEERIFVMIHNVNPGLPMVGDHPTDAAVREVEIWEIRICILPVLSTWSRPRMLIRF